ncbi:unnamed protein product [Diplocarpon coronariae]|nr:hypothetical protein JHW43_004187 [Diplocarpon mali]
MEAKTPRLDVGDPCWQNPLWNDEEECNLSSPRRVGVGFAESQALIAYASGTDRRRKFPDGDPSRHPIPHSHDHPVRAMRLCCSARENGRKNRCKMRNPELSPPAQTLHSDAVLGRGAGCGFRRRRSFSRALPVTTTATTTATAATAKPLPHGYDLRSPAAVEAGPRWRLERVSLPAWHGRPPTLCTYPVGFASAEPPSPHLTSPHCTAPHRTAPPHHRTTAAPQPGRRSRRESLASRPAWDGAGSCQDQAAASTSGV